MITVLTLYLAVHKVLLFNYPSKIHHIILQPLLKSYNERTHSVKIDKIMSKSISNLYGVPQGLILCPILFNIFINDTPKINSSPGIITSTTIFADDIQLLFSGTPNNLQQ